MKRISILLIAGLVFILLFANPTAAERKGKDIVVRTLDAREITGVYIFKNTSEL